MSTETEGLSPEPSALPAVWTYERKMFRYVVPVDDQAHEFTLTCNPVAVAVTEHGTYGWAVEFWAEHTGDAGIARAFRVFGTGHPLPPGARWAGTCPRLAGLVWHLYEIRAE